MAIGTAARDMFRRKMYPGVKQSGPHTVVTAKNAGLWGNIYNTTRLELNLLNVLTPQRLEVRQTWLQRLGLVSRGNCWRRAAIPTERIIVSFFTAQPFS